MADRETNPLRELVRPSTGKRRHVRPEILEDLYLNGHNDDVRHQLSTVARACVSTSRTVSTLASRRNRILFESVAKIKKMRGTIHRMETMVATGELPRAPEPEDSDDEQEEKEEEPVSVAQIEEFIESFYKSLETTEESIPTLDDDVKESRRLEEEIMGMISEGRKIKRTLDKDGDSYAFDLMNPRVEGNEACFKTIEELTKSFLDLQRRLLDFSEGVLHIERSEPVQKVNELLDDLRAATVRFGCPRE